MIAEKAITKRMQLDLDRDSDNSGFLKEVYFEGQ
jgi:hypothetical protein